MNLSFAGCGFLGLYHMGVASCFKEYAPNILVNKVSGTSAGALAAAAMLCDCPLSDVIVDSFKVAKAARRHTLGPFHPYIDITKILQERLCEVLPEDAHLRCNGKLFVSVTRVSDAKNYIISEFDSKEELIQALLCTSFIPFFSGYRPPYYREVRYIDGCYTDNLPLLDANTITVSPFCGQSDISPVDSCLSFGEFTVGNTHFEVNKMNLGRILRIIFPCDSAMLSKICEQGFYDALNFLKRNNLISCGKCISPLITLHAKPLSEEQRAIQRSDAEPESKDTHKPDSEKPQETNVEPETEQSHKPHDKEPEEYDPWDDVKNCQDCLSKHKSAHAEYALTEELAVALQKGRAVNDGIIDWLLDNPLMNILQVLWFPWILPLDLTVSSIAELTMRLPDIMASMRSFMKTLLAHAVALAKKIISERQLISAEYVSFVKELLRGPFWGIQCKVDYDMIRVIL